jgi:hypothetical protein
MSTNVLCSISAGLSNDGSEITMAEATLDPETILRTIRAWPRVQQEQFARAILYALESEKEQDPPIDPVTGRPYVSSQDLRGLLATPGRPAPTDEEIERLRMETYGY